MRININIKRSLLVLLWNNRLMSTKIQQQRSPRIAIVGCGPAGLYVCAGLLRKLPQCNIDIIECNAVPYGLIRYGVAPDHAEVKNCMNKFDQMFSTNTHRLSLYCNVCVGKEISFDELSMDYDAIVLAYGATRQRRLNIDGIRSHNVFSGADFVSWYNAFPGAVQPDLTPNNAVIIGVGNVALDCCRILLSSNSERLLKSDMPSDVLNQLNNSNIHNVNIIARRGPLDVSFTIKELREQIKLPNCSCSIEISENDLKLIHNLLQSLKRPQKRLIELMLDNCNCNNKQKLHRHCEIMFRRSPIRILSDEKNRVKGVIVMNSETKLEEYIECGLFIYSIGYENVVLDGIAKDENGNMKMLDSIRVDSHFNSHQTLIYACGWCAHQPRGVIANTQIESTRVVAALCSDIASKGLKSHLESTLKERLQLKNIKYRNWQQWKEIDEKEKSLGYQHGKLREKITNFIH